MKGGIGRLLFAALSAGALSMGCDGKHYDSDASDPPNGSGPTAKLRAAETSVLYAPYQGKHHVVAAYNDQAGFYDVGPNNTLVDKPLQSNAGLSYSLDGGKSWVRHGPLSPNPSCATPPCPTLMRGDPWLATNGARVLYSDLAMTVPSPDLGADLPDAVAVAVSKDGGVTFQDFEIALHDPGQFVDKPSLAMVGNTAVIAAVRANNDISAPLLMATSDNEGDGWSTLTYLAGTESGQKENPIVRLRDATHGYIAYMVPNSDAIYDLRVASISRDVGSPYWTAKPAYSRDNVQIDPFIQGAQSRWWRDVVPVSFDVGEDGKHLYVAYREISSKTSRSVVKVADCIDEPIGTCNAGGRGTWRLQIMTAYNGEAEYQPGITASKLAGDKTVALTWYERDSTDPTDLKVLTVGLYSEDGADTWSLHYNIHSQAPPWTPCPNASATQANPGDIGDYFGSAILPLDYGIDKIPWIVSAYTNSDFGCQKLNEITYDQHVQAVVW